MDAADHDLGNDPNNLRPSPLACAIHPLLLPRNEKSTFMVLKLGENFRRLNVSAKCSVVVFELKSGNARTMRPSATRSRIFYGVFALASSRAPMALGAKSDEIRRGIAQGRPAYMLIAPS